MYVYNLIVKSGDLDQQAAGAMVNQQLVRRFGNEVGYVITAFTDNEVVVGLRGESKRSMQGTLGEWFGEGTRTEAGEAAEAERKGGYPVGTLLHYRELLPSESPYKNVLGG